jgi:hypothetical protein
MWEPLWAYWLYRLVGKAVGVRRMWGGS